MGKRMNSEALGKFYNGGRTKVRREWRGLADTPIHGLIISVG